jgi:hypothetical protein
MALAIVIARVVTIIICFGSALEILYAVPRKRLSQVTNACRRVRAAAAGSLISFYSRFSGVGDEGSSSFAEIAAPECPQDIPGLGRKPRRGRSNHVYLIGHAAGR